MAPPPPPPPPSAAAPPAAPAARESDESIARKMFWGGCCLLPWLWILCLIHYRSRFFDKSAHPDLRWYLRAQVIGLVIMTAVFISWVALFQLQWRSWGWGANMLIWNPDTYWWADLT